MLTMTFKARVSSLGDIVVFLINYAWTIMSNAIGIWYTVYRFQQSIMCFTVSICRFFINFTSLITLVSIFAVTETQTYDWSLSNLHHPSTWSSRGSVVKALYFRPMNLGSIPAGTTHMSHWWQPEGHPAKAAPVHQKIPTIRGHVRAFVMRACSTLKASLFFDVSDVPSVCLVYTLWLYTIC